MIRSLLLSLLLLTSVGAWLTEEKDIEVIPNPHDNKGCLPSLDGMLEPYHLLTKPVATQADTFQELSYAKVLSVPIPIYRMKQPNRISHLELEFKLALVKDLSNAAKPQVHEVTVPMEQARDSWFPGYYWSPIVMGCGGGYQHVGWKFTAIDNNKPMPFFYALMVQVDETERTQGVRIGGFRAPGWMAAAIIS